MRLWPQFGRLTRDNQISRPLHIVASPYCTDADALAVLLREWGVGKSVMPENLAMLSRFRETIAEANFTVQKHLSAGVYLQRHGPRVAQILAPLSKRVAKYDIFTKGPFGQTSLHPYTRKAVAPQAKFIWLTRDRDAWFDDVQKLELSQPDMYPEHVQWEENPQARRALLGERLRKERRKFIRLSKEFPEDCIEIDQDKKNAIDKLAAFYGR